MKTLTFGQDQSFVWISIFVVCIKKTLTAQGFWRIRGPLYIEKLSFCFQMVWLSCLLFSFLVGVGSVIRPLDSFAAFKGCSSHNVGFLSFRGLKVFSVGNQNCYEVFTA